MRLRGDLRLAGGVDHEAHFLHRARQRLYAAEVLALGERGKGDERVPVVGRAAVAGVDLVAFVRKELAEVLVLPRLRELLEHPLGVLPVEVAERDHLEAGLLDLRELRVSDAAHADAAHGDAVRRRVRTAHGVRYDHGRHACGEHAPDEMLAGCHVITSPFPLP